MQKIFLTGNLTNEPEIRSTPSGASVCVFTIAVNRRAQKNSQPVTDFYRINAWGGHAEACNKYLKKGKKVGVIGELHPSVYTNKNGDAKLALDVYAEEVEFLSPSEKAEKKAKEEAGLTDISSDGLPF